MHATIHSGTSMPTPTIQFSVFTKPWRLPLPELAAQVKAWSFDGVELPVRPGYQVPPENVKRGLPEAVRILGEYGLKIFSIAGPTDETTIAACAEQGVPLIRIMADLGSRGYLEGEDALRRDFDRFLPMLEKYGVKVGVQNHYGRMVCHALGLRRLLRGYDPQCIGAVWDAAHNALQGEEPELALDILWQVLLMVNLKNACWQRTNPAEDGPAEWAPWWTSGRLGLASWPRVAAELKRRRYSGVVCLTAEYSEEKEVNRLIGEDIVYARELF
ncbi:MAG: TIM barrel protein [Anaerolineaceae bacterium]